MAPGVSATSANSTIESRLPSKGRCAGRRAKGLSACASPAYVSAALSSGGPTIWVRRTDEIRGD